MFDDWQVFFLMFCISSLSERNFLSYYTVVYSYKAPSDLVFLINLDTPPKIYPINLVFFGGFLAYADLARVQQLLETL